MRSRILLWLDVLTTISVESNDVVRLASEQTVWTTMPLMPSAAPKPTITIPTAGDIAPQYPIAFDRLTNVVTSPITGPERALSGLTHHRPASWTITLGSPGRLPRRGDAAR